MTSFTIQSPPLTINDFRPCCNGWRDYEKVMVDFSKNSLSQRILNTFDYANLHKPLFLNEGSSLFKLDSSTGKLYINFRLKFLHISQISVVPLSIPFKSILLIITAVFKTITFFHFWKPSLEPLTLSDKLKSTAADIARIATAPLFAVSLIFCCFYGIILPNNARKIEGVIYQLYDTSSTAGAFNISKSELKVLSLLRHPRLNTKKPPQKGALLSY